MLAQELGGKTWMGNVKVCLHNPSSFMPSVVTASTSNMNHSIGYQVPRWHSCTLIALIIHFILRGKLHFHIPGGWSRGGERPYSSVTTANTP